MKKEYSKLYKCPECGKPALLHKTYCGAECRRNNFGRFQISYKKVHDPLYRAFIDDNIIKDI